MSLGRHDRDQRPRVNPESARPVIARLFRRSRDEHIVAQLYGRIVDHARSSSFYAEVGVPDTIDGRYELLVLHAFLFMRRMKHEGDAAETFSQKLFDYMFADMDHSLRELGVGDLSVGKKVKQMARSFYGSVVAYDEALAGDGGEGALEEALQRNLYGTAEPDQHQLAAMADYVRREVANLARVPTEELLKGGVSFGSPVVPASGGFAAANGATPKQEAATAQENTDG